MVVVAAFFAAAPASAAEPKRPEFPQVIQTVVVYFQSVPGFQPGDLVSQGQVAAALDGIAGIGWEVPNREKLVSRALADNSFLLKQSATPDGKKFMRRVAKQPGGYPRLDRLSTITGGQKLIRDLIKDKDGDLMIQYLATTSGGHTLGEMMAATPNGVDLNKPTGRIYTMEDLLRALAKTYDGKSP